MAIAGTMSVARTTTDCGAVGEAATTQQDEWSHDNTRITESLLTSVEFDGDFAFCTVGVTHR